MDRADEDMVQWWFWAGLMVGLDDLRHLFQTL